MGWWSETIMGGDSPLDIAQCFEDRFGTRKDINPEEAIKLIDDTIAMWKCDECIIKQVVGFMMIERGCSFSSELRKVVLEGIDDEDTTSWKDSSTRDEKLREFRNIVEAYPVEGGLAELPRQEGLFQKIFEKLVELR